MDSASPSEKLKSQQSEESIMDFVCTLMPEDIRDGAVSCFKQIVQFENEESQSDHGSFDCSRKKDYFPDFDIMGHSIPSPFDDQCSDEEPQQMDNQKENISPKQMYLMTPLKMKFSSATRSPLQDITPSIRKKQKPTTSCFTYDKNSLLNQTPKTMADSRVKQSSSSRLRMFRM